MSKINKKRTLRSELKESMQWCIDNDKSTEFMIEYMQKQCNVDHEVVMQYLYQESMK